ncbi:hypothetical protein AMEX_G13211 [Astyanax mexicanus]|uniref:Uncharacterized protein n=1 Tax=Astyanax mexicanus TaxID=7994 RepID=A0A8T2LRL3_ASTMX|nr:hypothetical protein AMEX_G13211 [Astyanax mexicanus]
MSFPGFFSGLELLDYLDWLEEHHPISPDQPLVSFFTACSTPLSSRSSGRTGSSTGCGVCAAMLHTCASWN